MCKKEKTLMLLKGRNCNNCGHRFLKLRNKFDTILDMYCGTASCPLPQEFFCEGWIDDK
jgi:hypothetical protein